MWQKLIRLCGEVLATPTENEEIQFLCIVCAKLKQDPYLVNFFLEVSTSIQNLMGVFTVSHTKSSRENCRRHIVLHSLVFIPSVIFYPVILEVLFGIFFLPETSYIWFSLECHSRLTNTPAQGPFPLQWKCLQSRDMNCNVEHCVREALAALCCFCHSSED